MAAHAPAHLKRAELAEPRGPRRWPDGMWARAVGGLAVVGLMAAGVVAIASRVIEEAVRSEDCSARRHGPSQDGPAVEDARLPAVGHPCRRRSSLFSGDLARP